MTPTPENRGERPQGDTVLGPSSFRFRYLDPYAEAFRAWLHDGADSLGVRAATTVVSNDVATILRFPMIPP